MVESFFVISPARRSRSRSAVGDVVDGGREAQYAVYQETRRTIREPVYEIPGNHDPQELFEKHICPDGRNVRRVPYPRDEEFF